MDEGRTARARLANSAAPYRFTYRSMNSLMDGKLSRIFREWDIPRAATATAVAVRPRKSRQIVRVSAEKRVYIRSNSTTGYCPRVWAVCRLEFSASRRHRRRRVCESDNDSRKNLIRIFLVKSEPPRPSRLAVTADGREIELENKHYDLLIDIGRRMYIDVARRDATERYREQRDFSRQA